MDRVILQPSISVIIPCNNNAHFLEIVLQSLKNQSSPPEEIICIDDSSNSTEFNLIKKTCNHFGIRLLKLPKSRQGLGRRSKARNYGTRIAKGDICLYLDGDMLLGPDYIREIRYLHSIDEKIMIKGTRYNLSIREQSNGINYCIERLMGHEHAIKVQQDLYRVSPQPAKTSNMNDRIFLSSVFFADQLKYMRLSRKTFLFVMVNLLITRKGIDKIKLYSQIPYSSRWDYCASNNLSVRSKYVKEIGCWDENFIGWGEEDIDFAYRLYKIGVLPVIPESGPIYAYHLEHEIDNASNRLSLEMNARYFIKKFPIMQNYRKEVYAHYGIKL